MFERILVAVDGSKHSDAAFDMAVEIAYRIKEAAQHGSGIHAAIDRIARKNGFDESTVPRRYLESLAAREKIGSSQRYGHLFESHKIWTADPHVQMYLDSISEKVLR